MSYRLDVTRGVPCVPVRARKQHVCTLCDDIIPVGMLHQVWTWFDRGEAPIKMRGHDLCTKANVVETYMVGPFDRTETRSVGINGDGYVDGEQGAEDGWTILEYQAPASSWGPEDDHGDWQAHVWPPDLHGWLISLPPIEWSAV